MIGWYVHHHGRGHVTRAAAILPHLRLPATVLSSAGLDGVDLGATGLVRLPSDVGEGTTPPSLHYAPLGGEGLRRRAAEIVVWIDREQPRLLVVDVSVEVALLARLTGTPLVVVRQHGDRGDPPHRLGYGVATSLLAPYPEELEDPTADPELRRRTTYTGLFSRFDGRTVERAAARRRIGVADDERLVVVLSGTGGDGHDLADVRAADRATPGWRWLALGAGSSDDPLGAGWVDDPLPHLRAADVVVAGAGHNTVCEVLAADRPLVCIPEDRPFGEQHAKARALARAGAAVVAERWPSPERWPDLLAAAGDLDPAVRRRLSDGEGAVRAARHLEDLAAALPGHPPG